MTTITKNSGSLTKNVLAASALALISHGATAAGFDDANQMATNVRAGIYAFIGILAGIVVLWQCFEGSQGRKQWGDILVTCLWVVGAAASIALVTWLWTKGGSMSFS